jgi:hypothetical protein
MASLIEQDAINAIFLDPFSIDAANASRILEEFPFVACCIKSSSRNLAALPEARLGWRIDVTRR